MLARLRALLQRSGGPPRATLGRFALDPVAHALATDDVVVRLSPTEFRLLARLATTPGAVVRRAALVATGWPDGAIVYDNTLDAFMARIRRKQSALPDAPRIKSVYGVGYSIE